MNRIEKLMKALPEGADAALITSDVNRRYFTGLGSTAGTLLAFRDAAYFIIDFRYIEVAKATVTGAEVILQDKLYDQLGELLKKHGARTVALETDYITVGSLEQYRSRLPQVEFLTAAALDDKILELRSLTDEGEIAAIRKAQSITYAAFTETGLALAETLARALPGPVTRCGHGGPSLAEWTAAAFAQNEALIFVGAVGIAVRAIAPLCRSKASDPAVVVVDECGHFAVPLLSGHLGGANDLARAIAALCGAVPVITTATDAHGLFAVDEWARHHNCRVLEPERIKTVSGKLLAGEPVLFWSEFPITGPAPAGVNAAPAPEAADFALTLSPAGNALHLAPRIGVLGIGCRRGTTAEQLEAAFSAFCAAHTLPRSASQPPPAST